MRSHLGGADYGGSGAAIAAAGSVAITDLWSRVLDALGTPPSPWVRVWGGAAPPRFASASITTTTTTIRATCNIPASIARVATSVARGVAE